MAACDLFCKDCSIENCSSDKKIEKKKVDNWTSASWCFDECLYDDKKDCCNCIRQNYCEWCENGGEGPYVSDVCKECVHS